MNQRYLICCHAFEGTGKMPRVFRGLSVYSLERVIAQVAIFRQHYPQNRYYIEPIQNA
jgi:hypothetical protein